MYYPIAGELFHVHTQRCKHAGTERDYEYVEKAVELGAGRIVFTDHCPFPEDVFENRMKMEQLPEYIASMKELKREYGNQIEVLMGLEVEYLPRFDGYIKELKASGEFDLLVLGQHMFEREDGRWSFYDEDKSLEYIGLCKAMAEGAKTGCFDVIAHPDRVFRRCKKWTSDMEEACKEVIEAADVHGLYLEKNYASMQRKNQYWKEFWDCAAGVRQLYGYDAHSVKDLEELI